MKDKRNGIAIAKEQGKFKGGQVKRIKEEDFEKAYNLYKSREISKKEMAEMLHISRPTLDKLLTDKGLK